MAEFSLPDTQVAVRLTGADRVELDTSKPVPRPGPRQIVIKVDAVGLCFSDMKLLHQFSDHPRKAAVISGVDAHVLAGLESYRPGLVPTVPGHEVVGTVVAVGDQAGSCKVGDRRLIQPDFRAMKTPGSNGAFGYNFEGALQEYVLLDERVVVDAAGAQPYLLPADASLGRSAVALVEPWACVENSYRTAERQSVLPNGRLLVLAEDPEDFEIAHALYPPAQGPAHANHVQLSSDVETSLNRIRSKPDEFYDDVVVFGAHSEALEAVSDKIATRGIVNVVLGGAAFGRPIEIGIGRVHYGYTRWVGTQGPDPADGYRMIPANGEIKPGSRVKVVGAGGPMGQMHALRALGMSPLEVVATDLDAARLAALARKAPERAPLRLSDGQGEAGFDYIAVMAPVPGLVGHAIADCAPGGIVNLFAGIPAPVKHAFDLDALIQKRVFVFGTSGSETADMLTVYEKLKAGSLNTDLSVDAVSGMAGALDGLQAVRDRTMAGKIIVYPQLKKLGLTTLEALAARFPSVGARLDRGLWTKQAEDELLQVAD